MMNSVTRIPKPAVAVVALLLLQPALAQACPCKSPISSFPSNEDLEGEPVCGTSCGNPCVLVGDWSNVTDESDDFDWTIDEGGTSSTQTGPSQDANPGTSTGNYAYTETSGTSCQNAAAHLLSPCFDIGSLASPSFVFAYHMFGSDIGSLSVDVSIDDCDTWTNELTITGQQQSSNSDPWLYATVDLSAYAGATNLRIRIRGETAGSFNGDMAIDDMSVKQTADLNGDGIVDILDLVILLGAWGPCGDCSDCPADFDGDCMVGITDLLLVLASWD